MTKSLFFVLFFGISSTTVFSQKGGLGLKFHYALGSHEHHYGLGLHAWVQFDRIQINVGSVLSYELTGLGGRKTYFQNRSYLGVQALGGTKTTLTEFDWGTLNNYTNFKNAVGFAYLWYLDGRGTSQLSGAFQAEFNGHSAYIENDFFAGQGKDRFRTGHMVYRYRREFWGLRLGLRLWTGETSGLPVQNTAMRNKKVYFKNLSGNPYGKTSHGILYFGTDYALGFKQVLSMQMGVDDERIRDFFQNKVAHSDFFHRQNERAVVYPKLNAEGLPILFGGEIRPPRLYFEVRGGGE